MLLQRLPQAHDLILIIAQALEIDPQDESAQNAYDECSANLMMKASKKIPKEHMLQRMDYDDLSHHECIQKIKRYSIPSIPRYKSILFSLLAGSTEDKELGVALVDGRMLTDGSGFEEELNKNKEVFPLLLDVAYLTEGPESNSQVYFHHSSFSFAYNYTEIRWNWRIEC